eukprot:PhM_4_TR4756/c0_g1_i1/m.69313
MSDADLTRLEQPSMPSSSIMSILDGHAHSQSRCIQGLLSPMFSSNDDSSSVHLSQSRSPPPPPATPSSGFSPSVARCAAEDFLSQSPAHRSLGRSSGQQRHMIGLLHTASLARSQLIELRQCLLGIKTCVKQYLCAAAEDCVTEVLHSVCAPLLDKIFLLEREVVTLRSELAAAKAQHSRRLDDEQQHHDQRRVQRGKQEQALASLMLSMHKAYQDMLLDENDAIIGAATGAMGTMWKDVEVSRESTRLRELRRHEAKRRLGHFRSPQQSDDVATSPASSRTTAMVHDLLHLAPTTPLRKGSVQRGLFSPERAGTMTVKDGAAATGMLRKASSPLAGHGYRIIDHPRDSSPGRPSPSSRYHREKHLSRIAQQQRKHAPPTNSRPLVVELVKTPTRSERHGMPPQKTNVSPLNLYV